MVCIAKKRTVCGKQDVLQYINKSDPTGHQLNVLRHEHSSVKRGLVKLLNSNLGQCLLRWLDTVFKHCEIIELNPCG